MTVQYQLAVLEPEAATGSLETRFDAAFVARLALREKQIQQSYRPIIQVHKWFARRPGSVFRSLLLAEFGDGPVAQNYYSGNRVQGTIADPFMGGGTTVFEGSRIGLGVVGSDINPMAFWTVRQAVAPLSLRSFKNEAALVVADVRAKIGDLYATTCAECGGLAQVKYFHHVKTCACPKCGEEVSLFPGLRLAEACRHPREVYHCPRCDGLKEVEKGSDPRCPTCGYDFGTRLTSRGSTTCGACGRSFRYSSQLGQPPSHRLFGIEYHCKACYPHLRGRQFKTPDADDLKRLREATLMLAEHLEELSLPDEEIPIGDETSRLHRWGYSQWRQLFSDRQLLGLGLLMRRVQEVEPVDAREALATVFSDFLRYQNLLCRYDTYALKCQDVFAVHGFPVALLACENNLLGIPGVGSGSFVHFVEKYRKAKEYAARPYETSWVGSKKTQIVALGESANVRFAGHPADVADGSAYLACEASQHLGLPDGCLDGVFTDPPYFANVQYAELMDFCYVWLRRLLADRPEFAAHTTRDDEEATGNRAQGRGMTEFTSALSAVFTAMGAALRDGAPLVFTYHHNDPNAYVPLVVAVLDAGLTCTAVLPTPGEMSASLHIAGTKSSILDSVFVCRDPDAAGNQPRPPESVQSAVATDVAAMRKVPYEPTAGDVACLTAGHVAGFAIRELAPEWDSEAPLDQRLALATARVQAVTTRSERQP